MQRHVRDLNENDKGKLFMIFEDDPNYHNRMFILESINPITVKYANYNDTNSTGRLDSEELLSREIVEIQIPPHLINELRKYTPSGLTYVEVQAATKRKTESASNSSGGAKKTLKKKRKYKKRK